MLAFSKLTDQRFSSPPDNSKLSIVPVRVFSRFGAMVPSSSSNTCPNVAVNSASAVKLAGGGRCDCTI